MGFPLGLLFGYVIGLLMTGYIIQTKFVTRDMLLKNKVCIDKEWGKLK